MIPELARGLAQTSTSFQPLRWLNVAALPPLIVGGVSLDSAQMTSLVTALRYSTLARPHPLLTLIRAHADRAALDALLWRLVDQWEAHRAPAGGRWAFAALGMLGGNDVARELARRIGDWRTQGRYERVALAMECIAAIGSETASQTLEHFAAQTRFPSLKDRAIDYMELAREIPAPSTTEQRVVGPDPCLDIFDFGARRFFLTLDSDSRPVVCDEQGRHRPVLPKPARNDNPDLAAQAIKRWRAAQKTATQAVDMQARRLEQAMVDGERWHPEQWRTTICDHPLIRSLARRLIWAGYGTTGAFQEAFCISDDRSAVNDAYETVDVDQYHSIGVAHPLDLLPERRLQWAEVLQDFHIIPLFAQVGRVTYMPTIGSEQTTIIDFRGRRLKQRSIRQLRERQWKSTGYEHVDGVEIFYTLRQFAGAHLTAVMRTSRQHASAGHICECVQECFFVRGLRTDYRERKAPKLLLLREVSPVIISEVLLDWNDLVYNPIYHYED